MSCTNCQDTTPCTTPDCSCKVFLETPCITYTGTEIECLGIETGTELTTVIEKLGEGICNFTPTPSTTQLVNTGNGAIIYSGDNGQGQKQLKSLEEGTGVVITTDANEITIGIDPDYLKENGGGLIFENIVEFDSDDPNDDPTVFEPNQPQDDDVLYWSSVDNRNWKWNGTVYVLANANPESTPFFLSSTVNDAGGNKTANIWRRGFMGIGTDNPLQALHVVGTVRQTGAVGGLVKANASGDLINAVAGTDYLTPTGSAAGLTSFPTLNQNTTGNAATVTTNANLSGDVTSVGNTTTLSNSGVTAGSYTSANIIVDAKGRVTTASNGGLGRVLKDFYTDAPNSTTTLTTLYTYTIPANTLITNGDKIKAEYAGKLANGTSKDLNITLGANTYTYKATTDGGFTIKVNIVRTGASTANVSLEYIMDNAEYMVDVVQWTITGWNSATTLSLSAQGTGTGDIVAYIGTIMYIPAAI